MRSVGSKNDGDGLGKDPWQLLPLGPISEVVRVLGFGARRYGVGNWKLVDGARDRYYAAAMRHLVEWRSGELIDSDSGLPHIAHAICNLVFLSWFDKQGEKVLTARLEPVTIGSHAKNTKKHRRA